MKQENHTKEKQSHIIWGKLQNKDIKDKCREEIEERLEKCSEVTLIEEM